MGFFSKIAVAGLVGFCINRARKISAEEGKRTNTPCNFEDGITQNEFKKIVSNARRKIKRLKELYSNGPVVYGTVISQSGQSAWNFKIDFNDYGHISGTYWLTSDNYDSDIPEIVADRIRDAILDIYSHMDDIDYKSNHREYEYDTSHQGVCCPFCGKKISILGASFCGFCGRRLHI